MTYLDYVLYLNYEKVKLEFCFAQIVLRTTYLTYRASVNPQARLEQKQEKGAKKAKFWGDLRLSLTGSKGKDSAETEPAKDVTVETPESVASDDSGVEGTDRRGGSEGGTSEEKGDLELLAELERVAPGSFPSEVSIAKVKAIEERLEAEEREREATIARLNQKMEEASLLLQATEELTLRTQSAQQIARVKRPKK